MIISLRLYDEDGVSCLSESCIFKRECANHLTAGDQRSKDGFTPELEQVGSAYVCNTTHQAISMIEGYFPFGCYPDNIESLGRGALLQKDLQYNFVDEYQI